VNVTTYSSAQVCKLAGVTYRQLDYWVRQGLIEPTVAARGSGSKRRWTWDDIERARRLRLAARLASGTILDALDVLDDLDQLTTV
jgi:DNA-binding transcriptional MerR regulator